MLQRRFISCLSLGLLGLCVSNATLLLHHDDACDSTHPTKSDCRACYLIKVGRTAVAETPLVVPIIERLATEVACDARITTIVAARHTPAAPRAPPVA